MLKVIKNQKYQTKEEVETAVRGTMKNALTSSIRHWNELATAPVGDLTRKLGLSAGECALCVRNFGMTCDANSCILYEKLGEACYTRGSIYDTALRLKRIIHSAIIKKNKDAAIKRFRRVAENMIKLLESCKELL